MFLADAVAGYLEYLTADNGGLAGVREIDSFCAGDPAGPLLIRPRSRSSMTSCGVSRSSGRILSNTSLCRVGWFPLTVIR